MQAALGVRCRWEGAIHTQGDTLIPRGVEALARSRLDPLYAGRAALEKETGAMDGKGPQQTRAALGDIWCAVYIRDVDGNESARAELLFLMTVESTSSVRPGKRGVLIESGKFPPPVESLFKRCVGTQEKWNGLIYSSGA